MNRPRTLASALAATLLLALAAQPAAAACTPFLCYIDLANGGGSVCPNGAVYTVLQSHPVATTPQNPTCNVAPWRAVVARVDVPAGCTGVSVLVEYEGEPEGFTVDIADSETDDGFGGDGGTLPSGQNAEVQVLGDDLSVYNAANNPADVEQLATQQLALKDGALQFVVKDQFLSWGQPYSAVSTPDLQRLFFLPASPTAPDNRTIYVGLNRVVSPINGQNTFRNGCGARRALLVLQ